jgi:hypothetical protein
LVMMRSESTSALGQPRLTKPIFGAVCLGGIEVIGRAYTAQLHLSPGLSEKQRALTGSLVAVAEMGRRSAEAAAEATVEIGHLVEARGMGDLAYPQFIATPIGEHRACLLQAQL